MTTTADIKRIQAEQDKARQDAYYLAMLYSMGMI